jgi:hypothetical protein
MRNSRSSAIGNVLRLKYGPPTETFSPVRASAISG